MQLRALAHRSASLSLRRQMDAVSGGRVFTTLGVVPRTSIAEQVQFLNDEDDDEGLPDLAAHDVAREARLVGELSDCSAAESDGELDALGLPPASPCSAWDSEDEYPLDVRVLSRPLSQVLEDAASWQVQRAQVTPAALPSSPPPLQAKKKGRRGGKAKKPRSHWSETQRQAEKTSAAYTNRVALVRAARQTKRLDERREAAPPGAAKHVEEADQYTSSFTLTGVASNRSPQVGQTSPVYREGFSRIGIAPTSRSGMRWLLRQALGPSEACNSYVCDLVKNHGYTYVPNASCAQVFTDADGVVYAVKVPQPSGDEWPQAVQYFAERMRKLHESLKLSHAANTNHARGNFVRMTCSTRRILSGQHC
ncbi:hypothetical protein AURDEDRAFT_131368 [Auricularia subglabra TFB-10046 SS5]|uniref:Uncharacterized protein n=1 Tax=Auricularia subglabra (strain TFB-10046 / SS5) TaxID=717982 RepID=J0CUN4_AURST|nr:hypothetical protein AURDEDRAFT_131368 [Auricularia subglabra TFB-10046 SS5]